VDASGRVVATTDPVGGLYIYAIGNTGRPLVVDASGMLILSPDSNILGIGGSGVSDLQGAYDGGNSIQLANGLPLSLIPPVAGSRGHVAFTGMSADPTSPLSGDLWYDSADDAFKYFAASGITPIGSKMAIDVREFGAIGDGSADDTENIQAAIDAMPAGGGALFFPRGTWKVSSNLIITKNVRVFGEGAASIVKASGTSLTAVFEMNSGAARTSISDLQIQGSKTTIGGSIQRGVYINGAKYCVVARCLFSGPNSSTGLNFGVDVNGAASARAIIINNRFERMVSNPSNGTAILLEATSECVVYGNVIDGSEFVNPLDSPSAAIFLSQTSDGLACTDNWIKSNRIVNHPQVGIALGSTTYAQFQVNLGENSNNTIEDNDVSFCAASGGGDASSGIVIQANSPFNIIKRNRVFRNGHASAGGFGIVLVGAKGVAKDITDATNASPIVITASGHGFSNSNSVGVSSVLGNTAANDTWTVANKTDNTFELSGSVGNGAYSGGGKVGLVGTAKIDEMPIFCEISDNLIAYNKDDGIKIKGVTKATIRGNFCYENGQRTANTFKNIDITSLGGDVNGSDCVIAINRLIGSQPKYHVSIGAGVSATTMFGNIMPVPGTAPFLDNGTDTIAVEAKTVPDARLHIYGKTSLGGSGVAGDTRVYSSAPGGTGAFGTIVCTSAGVLRFAGGGGSEASENQVEIGSHLRPLNDDSADFGETGKRWRSLRVGTGTASFEGNVGLRTQSPAENVHCSGALRVDETFYTPVRQEVSASGIVFNLAVGNIFRIPLSHNSTFTLNNPKAGAKYTFVLKQAVGSKIVTWPGTVKWRGAIAPTLTTASGSIDVVSLLYDQIGGIYLADYGLDFA